MTEPRENVRSAVRRTMRTLLVMAVLFLGGCVCMAIGGVLLHFRVAELEDRWDRLQVRPMQIQSEGEIQETIPVVTWPEAAGE